MKLLRTCLASSETRELAKPTNALNRKTDQTTNENVAIILPANMATQAHHLT
jgi:hypothetical protein